MKKRLLCLFIFIFLIIIIFLLCNLQVIKISKQYTPIYQNPDIQSSIVKYAYYKDKYIILEKVNIEDLVWLKILYDFSKIGWIIYNE